jgi:hypothetical protein
VVQVKAAAAYVQTLKQNRTSEKKKVESDLCGRSTCTRARLGVSATIAGERGSFRVNSGSLLTSCENEQKDGSTTRK